MKSFQPWDLSRDRILNPPVRLTFVQSIAYLLLAAAFGLTGIAMTFGGGFHPIILMGLMFLGMSARCLYLVIRSMRSS